MDDYLMKFGFTPATAGVDRYLKSEKTVDNMQVTQRTEKHKNSHRQINSDMHSHTKSRFNNIMLKDLPLAMAYVPMQWYEDSYTEEEALRMGTLFPELDKPFLGRRP